jgi:hypothetical protein
VIVEGFFDSSLLTDKSGVRRQMLSTFVLFFQRRAVEEIFPKGVALHLAEFTNCCSNIRDLVGLLKDNLPRIMPATVVGLVGPFPLTF